MSLASLTLNQARYNNRAFWRNPAAAFFTFIFPLMFLVLFNFIFGDDEFELDGRSISPSTYYVASILALAVINTCFTAISQSVAISRDQGLLKRLRGTPLPAAVFIAARILQQIFTGVILVALVLALGILAYGVDLPAERVPALIVSLFIGAACFCALGMAMSGLIPNAEAGPAVVNAVVLPLLFISDVFIPMDNAPAWLSDFASIFPVMHISQAMHTVFNPLADGAGFEVKSLLVMLAWGVAGAVAATRFFSWEPRK